jgi:glycosyltransferase involved in cell wall biosynthesis
MDHHERNGFSQANIDALREEPESIAPGTNIRIAYLSGPCDAPAVYVEWSERCQQDYFGSNYMKQFLQLCDELDAESYVITTLPGEFKQCKRGRFIFDNHPNPSGLKGIRYHVAFIPWFARVIPKIIRFKPDALIVTENQSYWFFLFCLRWFGIPIIPSFHCVPWPKYGHRKWSSRILWQINRLLILKYLKAIVVTSNDIARQIIELLGEKQSSHIEFVRHFPTYNPLQFSSIPLPTSVPRPPFRVFFAGRIETQKGVYDLLEIARRLDVERKGSIQFDICGDGGELDRLRKRIAHLKLEEVISCHGHCNAERLALLLGASHAWIVPTKSDFEAGFEMVCAEAILANRPLITSPVCPALEDVREATVEVQPDNVDQYYQAILRLNDDVDFYSRKQTACAALQEPFYNHKNSWGTKIKEVLAHYVMISAVPGQNAINAPNRFHERAP